MQYQKLDIEAAYPRSRANSRDSDDNNGSHDETKSLVVKSSDHNDNNVKNSNTPLVKLLFGAGGIYASFLYYGSLQEDVFKYVAEDGTTFQQAWFLQVLEALANVIVGYIGMMITGPTRGVPFKMFAISGATQVFAKTCTSLSLANGLSFPVATLAKSAKMAPVMAGSLVVGGATYNIREYLQVVAIMGGTAIVNFGGKHHGDESSSKSTILGLSYIIGSLIFDGTTAGFQKRLQVETAKLNCKPKPYDFMFWTNLFMGITAILFAILLNEITTGVSFCVNHPHIFIKILQFSLCSAIGQSFIFYTLANFDPLILTTITTTRKIFSVLFSVLVKGGKASLSVTGWLGILIACLGIASELLTIKDNKKTKASH